MIAHDNVALTQCGFVVVEGKRAGDARPVFYVPVLRELFKVAPLHPTDLVACLVAGMVAMVWIEALKLVYPVDIRS